ncbi:MAG: glycosyltransferase family 2 protein [Eubacterium sp.]|uniref:glycosyltransferase family 2 protein n=1 Tax=Eubacterium sp. TaxID=142586 RepID=UPI00399F3FB1
MSNSQPLVSVIMGIYNCADTLAESLDSLLVQTYQNFEIIMCNDGSTDNTFEIAKQYNDKYSDRIVLIENAKNMGLNYTLNHCLEYCKGEYIARMDGDDISLPLRFEKEVSFFGRASGNMQ